MKVKDFVDTDFRDFSMDDNVRSIPSAIDGLKESQRKAVFGLLNRGESAGLIKVAQAAGHVSKVSDYHHGEKSMEDTIVKLAQDFTGSNNINLFEPEGQFGSRLSPEASASRYIYTKLSDSFRQLYKKDDDLILDHKKSDGQKIEPNYYLPILPMVLVNGGLGIGTGYASKILCYNPNELKRFLINYLEKGTVPRKLLPWFKGFKGKIEREDNRITTYGIYKKVNTTTIQISELPIGMYLDKFKEHLNALEDKNIIKSYVDNSTEDGFDFEIIVPRNTTKLSDTRIINTFKLASRFGENYTLWNEDDKIKIFKDAREIVTYFADFRIKKYEERRLALIEAHKEKRDWLTEKQKFIKYYLKDPVGFSKKAKAALFADMQKEGFINIDKLLRLPIYTLTKDEIAKLMKSIKSVTDEIKRLAKITAKDMFISELKEFSYK
jgi:DNA topoisomerase-2